MSLGRADIHQTNRIVNDAHVRCSSCAVQGQGCVLLVKIVWYQHESYLTPRQTSSKGAAVYGDHCCATLVMAPLLTSLISDYNVWMCHKIPDWPASPETGMTLFVSCVCYVPKILCFMKMSWSGSPVCLCGCSRSHSTGTVQSVRGGNIILLLVTLNSNHRGKITIVTNHTLISGDLRPLLQPSTWAHCPTYCIRYADSCLFMRLTEHPNQLNLH